jgi:hypothetical protein
LDPHHSFDELALRNLDLFVDVELLRRFLIIRLDHSELARHFF